VRQEWQESGRGDSVRERRYTHVVCAAAPGTHLLLLDQDLHELLLQVHHLRLALVADARLVRRLVLQIRDRRALLLDRLQETLQLCVQSPLLPGVRHVDPAVLRGGEQRVLPRLFLHVADLFLQAVDLLLDVVALLVVRVLVRAQPFDVALQYLDAADIGRRGEG